MDIKAIKHTKKPFKFILIKLKCELEKLFIISTINVFILIGNKTILINFE